MTLIIIHKFLYFVDSYISIPFNQTFPFSIITAFDPDPFANIPPLTVIDLFHLVHEDSERFTHL